MDRVKILTGVLQHINAHRTDFKFHHNLYMLLNSEMTRENVIEGDFNYIMELNELQKYWDKADRISTSKNETYRIVVASFMRSIEKAINILNK